MNSKFSFLRWPYLFLGGFILWLLAIALGVIALKGNMQGFGSSQWWYQTGVVYLLWGFLNFLIFFGVVFFIIPYGLRTKKYWAMIILTLLLIFAVGLIKYYFVSLQRFEYVRVSYYTEEQDPKPVYFTFIQYMQKILFTGIFVSLLAYGFGLTLNWFKGEKLRKELEGKQRDAELSFLRMQLDLHFLFNTLNSIYSLSLQKSDYAPEAILKLSEMMRYMIYENEDESNRVEMKKEIEYLKNYIRLQQIRFKQVLNINLQIEGDAQDKKIVPLLIIPFVENAFKHGDLEDKAHPLMIRLSIENDKLVLQVKNKKNFDKRYYSGGVGLDNVKRRLSILYPNKHNIAIHETAEFYETDLTILF